MTKTNQVKQTLSFILVSVLLATPFGCGDDTEKPEVTGVASENTTAQNTANTGVTAENTTAQNTANAGPTPAGLQIENALALWTQNQKDQAANLLLQIDWSQPMRFSPDSYAFTLTEKDLASWDQTERSKVMDEIMTANGHFRTLAKHLVSLGQTALAQGDNENAQTYFQTTCHFGQIITGDADAVITVRLVGFTITHLGLRELITYYTQTNNQEKLQWAQQELQKVQTESKKYKDSIFKN